MGHREVVNIIIAHFYEILLDCSEVLWDFRLIWKFVQNLWKIVQIVTCLVPYNAHKPTALPHSFSHGSLRF